MKITTAFIMALASVLPAGAGNGPVCALEVLDIETGGRTVVREFDHKVEAPNWMPCGQRLLFNAEGRIWTISIDDPEDLRLIDTGFADACKNDHVISPDGTMLAISHGTREDGASRIYTLPIEGGTPRLVTPLGGSYLHGWSPDGVWLVYCADRGGEFDIYVIPARGGVERRLTDTPGLDDGPEYSPCGRYIWFNSVRSGTMQLWRMDADGGNQTRMTFDEDYNAWFPHLSPDGQWVVYLVYRAGDVAPGDHPPGKDVELRIMPAAGGPSRTLAALHGGQGTINVNSWSPDGGRIAFVSYSR